MSSVRTSYKKGVDAEDVAVQYLRLKGYGSLAQRYKTGVGEVDLIAEKDGGLVFVEVKAHKTMERALQAVTEKSRRRIEAAAMHFIMEHPEYNEYAMRFDVLIVPPNATPNLLGAVDVDHLDNAWFMGA